MNIKKSKNYIFENNILLHESYSREFTDKLFKEFQLKAKKIDLKSKINNLINGEIVNETENQAAFHPKYRSSSRQKNLIDAEVIAKNFFIPRINNCISSGYNEINIISLGIGGSYEGSKLLTECFKRPMLRDLPKLKKINYDFITGSDPNEFEDKIKSLTNENTFFIVSSKSFTTIETIESLKKAFNWSKSKKNFIGITANPSEAKRYGIEEIILFDKEIGGRYSIWSSIVQIHTCNEDFLNLAKGGNKADIDIQENEEYINFVKSLSFKDIYFNNRGIHVRAVLSYIWNLRSLPDYFQQLEMESLGKPAQTESEFRKTGQVIFGGYGPTAQHSYFQLLHQGTQDICADIIASTEDRKSLAYAQAITQSKLLSNGAEDLKKEEQINGNVPVNLFLLKNINPFTLGYMIATWEYRTYITAVMLGINPFDQFGVSAGKIFTKKYLEENGG